MARMVSGSPWDISATWSTNTDFRVRLQDLIAEWTNASFEKDTPTLLALLDILSSFVWWGEYADLVPDILTVATPIARSIIDHDPEAMDTRPFTQWVLVQCESAEGGSRDQRQRQEDLMDISMSPGIPYYRSGDTCLLQYAPYKTETPDWGFKDGPSELQNSARMALRTSTNRSDYRTQAKTLQLLILMSANPVKEFEDLENLQSLTQGDNYNFAETLAAKYLISRDSRSRRKLRDELANHWAITTFSSGFSLRQLWVLTKIRQALAQDEMEAERILSEADAYYKDTHSTSFADYENQFPPKRDVGQGRNEARTARSERTERRNNHRVTSFSPSPEPPPRYRWDDRRLSMTSDYKGDNSEYDRESAWERSSRLKTLADTRDRWTSRTSTRNIRDTRMSVSDDPRYVSERRPAPRPIPPPRTSTHHYDHYPWPAQDYVVDGLRSTNSKKHVNLIYKENY